MSLARMLAAMADDDNERPSLPSPEGQIARLVEYLDHRAQPLPFKVGDFVTVRSDAPIKGAGQPHVVVETNADAGLSWVGAESGDWQFGARYTMRVACLHPSGFLIEHWVWHGHFAPYEAAP